MAYPESLCVVPSIAQVTQTYAEVRYMSLAENIHVVYGSKIDANLMRFEIHGLGFFEWYLFHSSRQKYRILREGKPRTLDCL